jgi:hypothetical protein
MCVRVTCKSCGKPTYTGCGRHIEAVLGDVPVAARCQCRQRDATESPPNGRLESWVAALLGKSRGRRS